MTEISVSISSPHILWESSLEDLTLLNLFKHQSYSYRCKLQDIGFCVLLYQFQKFYTHKHKLASARLACATSEDSDQPAHLRSLIRVFADRMCLLQPPGYPKRDKKRTFAILGGCTG